MRRRAETLFVLLTACGSDDEPQRTAPRPETAADLALVMGGIYRIESTLESKGSCDAASARTKQAGAESMLVVIPTPETPDVAARALTCSSIEDCRARIHEPGAAEHLHFFTRREGDKLTGDHAFGGFARPPSTCEKASAGTVSIRLVGDTVELEQRTTTGDISSLGEVCATHRARKALASKPCNDLLVFRAKRIEPLKP